MERPKTSQEVEDYNDEFARLHDINAYYADSGVLIRAVERRRLETIRRMMSARPGTKILEVGCGGGHVLKMFPEAKLTGIDVSGEMLRKAEQNLRGLDFELVKGDLRDIAFESDRFDGVVCTEVLEHVLEPEPILEEMARVARPGARVVITFPNDHLINRIKGALRTLRLTAVPPFRRIAWGGDHYHLHVWTVGEMRALLSRYFMVEEESFAPHRGFPIRACFKCRNR